MLEGPNVEIPHVRRSGYPRFNYHKIHIDNQFIFVTYNGNLTPNLHPDPHPPQSEAKYIDIVKTFFPWSGAGSRIVNGYISIISHTTIFFVDMYFLSDNETFGHPDLRTSHIESEEIDFFVIYLGVYTDSDKGYHIKSGEEDS